MKHYDVIVVGGGIAGMTAAIYVRRANKTVLVLEGRTYGGQIINTLNIENWPGDMGVSGVDLVRKIYQQMTELGAEMEFETVTAVERSDNGFMVKTEDETYTAGAVIIAVGAEDKKLGLASEEKFTGRGVSYCATCDGAFYKGKKVAVIGGGNTALYDALYLADIVEKVYLVHRRSEFRGDSVLVERLRGKSNVEFVLGYVPEEIVGGKKVSGVRLVSSGKVADVKDGMDLDIDGVFVAIGKLPMTGGFAGLVELDTGGYIKAAEDCVTSCPGVFAAGDCRVKDMRQLVTAAADGAVAADKAVNYSNN